MSESSSATALVECDERAYMDAPQSGANLGEDCAGSLRARHPPADCVYHAHVTRYSTPATRCFSKRAHRKGKRKKKERDDVLCRCAAQGDAFGHDAPQIALLRDTL